MLQIILFVLKILGWILLIVLGLLVLVFLLALFTPLRYQVEAGCKGKLSALEAAVRFHIFFHLVSGTLSYQERKLTWNIRAAWIKLGDNRNAAEVAREAEETAGDVLETVEKKAEQTVDGVSDITEEKEEGTTDGAPDIVDEKAEGTAGKVQDIAEEKVKEIGLEEPEDEAPETVERTEEAETKYRQRAAVPVEEDNSDGVSQSSAHEKTASANEEESVEREEKEDNKIKKEKGVNENRGQGSLADKIAAVFEKIEYTFSRFCDKINALSKKAEIVTAFLANTAHQSAFWKLLAELKKLLFRMRPKQIDGELRFGFEDPALTGKVMAGFSMLSPYWEVRLYPDFEQKVLDGEVKAKGSARLWPAAVLAWNLVWNRDVRRTVLDIKRMIFK